MSCSRWVTWGSAASLALVTACHPPATSKPESAAPGWTPGVVYSTARAPNTRGLLDRRGLIHAHSVYSHDACDNKPVDANGNRDQTCFNDFRRDLCTSQHDFVMLTDHNTAFSTTEYPDSLLYRPDLGDVLVQRNGKPTASRAGCPDGHSSLILAGTESNLMPVGLEEHVDADQTTRSNIYGANTADSANAERAKGAVVLVAHTENWTVDQLTTLPLDGFEMYNVHANTLFTTYGKNAVLTMLGHLYDMDGGLPNNPNIVFLSIFWEDPRYIDTWGTVLSKGFKRVTTMGSDCHRNALPQLLSDGERIDSYRRVMGWFSNHLLVKPNADGAYDDLNLKEALRSGRLYGAFEVMGFPVGFDYRAEANGTVSEMGQEVSLADAPVLRVAKPSVQNLDKAATPPALTMRILRAVDNGFEEVAKGDGDLSFTPTLPGAYRAEVRIVPLHLRQEMGVVADEWLAHDYVWIYGNPIYVK
jgi:hypothetical protein